MATLTWFQRIQTNSHYIQIGIQLTFTQYTNIFSHYFCLCYRIFLIKILMITCPCLYTLSSKEWLRLSLSLLYVTCLQFVSVPQMQSLLQTIRAPKPLFHLLSEALLISWIKLIAAAYPPHSLFPYPS